VKAGTCGKKNGGDGMRMKGKQKRRKGRRGEPLGA
jgi:hypothetical protein